MKTKEIVHFAVAGNDWRGHLRASLGFFVTSAVVGGALYIIAFIGQVL